MQKEFLNESHRKQINNKYKTNNTLVLRIREGSYEDIYELTMFLRGWFAELKVVGY